jgi:hypothetical protein
MRIRAAGKTVECPLMLMREVEGCVDAGAALAVVVGAVAGIVAGAAFGAAGCTAGARSQPTANEKTIAIPVITRGINIDTHSAKPKPLMTLAWLEVYHQAQ